MGGFEAEVWCGGARLTFCVHDSALGTPLEWPEAKKNANHVRDWGIKVYISPIWGWAGGSG